MSIQHLIDTRSQSGLEPRFDYSVDPSTRFPHVFRLDPDTHSPYDGTLIVHTLRKWCEDNLEPSTWVITDTFLKRHFRFKKENDALLFKLHWL